LTYDKLKILLDNCFTTIRITEHDQSYKNEEVISLFLKHNPEYFHRITILRSDWKSYLLDWSGVIENANKNTSYIKQCPFYEMSAIDVYGNVLMCCNAAYFAREGKWHLNQSTDNIHKESFASIWGKNCDIRKSLFSGDHLSSIHLCKLCTGFQKGNNY